MIIGGAVKMGDHDSKIISASLRDGIEIEEDRVMLLVHDIKPPFLDGSDCIISSSVCGNVSPQVQGPRQ